MKAGTREMWQTKEKERAIGAERSGETVAVGDGRLCERDVGRDREKKEKTEKIGCFVTGVRAIRLRCWVKRE